MPRDENLITSSGGRLDDPKHPDHGKDYVQRYLDEYGARKVEANALVVRPEAGRELCREAILEYVDLVGVEEWCDVVEANRTDLKDRDQPTVGGGAPLSPRLALEQGFAPSPAAAPIPSMRRAHAPSSLPCTFHCARCGSHGYAVDGDRRRSGSLTESEAQAKKPAKIVRGAQ